MSIWGRLGRAVLFPDAYAWYVLMSSLDIMVTHTILHHFGGWEVNVLAAQLVERFGHWGLIALKFASVIVVVVVCEIVGRARPGLGRVLAVMAVVIGALPVGIGLLQLAVWMGWGGRLTPWAIRSPRRSRWCAARS